MADGRFELSLDTLQDMKVANLKKALKERGLSCGGNKPDLVLRLQNYLEQQSGLDSQDVIDDLPDSEETIQDGASLLVLDETANVVPPKKIILTQPIESQGVADKNHVVVTNINGQGLTDAEKVRKRAERFGSDVDSDDRRASRAARFGTTNVIKTTATSVSDGDKLKSRAERFKRTDNAAGAAVSAKVSDSEKLKARSERFHLSSANNTVDDTLRKRQERFGSAVSPDGKITIATSFDDDEARKRKRAARFGLS